MEPAASLTGASAGALQGEQGVPCNLTVLAIHTQRVCQLAAILPIQSLLEQSKARFPRR